jgi:hypothetical protein
MFEFKGRDRPAVFRFAPKHHKSHQMPRLPELPSARFTEFVEALTQIIASNE